MSAFSPSPPCTMFLSRLPLHVVHFQILKLPGARWQTARMGTCRNAKRSGDTNRLTHADSGLHQVATGHTVHARRVIPLPKPTRPKICETLPKNPGGRASRRRGRKSVLSGRILERWQFQRRSIGYQELGLQAHQSKRTRSVSFA